MLLNDTVGHRKPEAGAFLRALGGEERIVDAVQVLGGDAVAGIGDFDCARQRLRAQVRTSSVPPPAMASRAFRNRFRNTCCSLPALPCTGGRSGIEVGLHLDAGLLQLVLQQRERLLDHAVQVDVAEGGGGGAREVQQRIDDLAGAEGLLGDLVEDACDFCESSATCLASICA